MDLLPLTVYQQQFAAANEDLVYAFLQEKDLPESLFYDVVIFGYLQAVQEYCTDPKLRRHEFSTLAWKRMRRALFNYDKHLKSPKCNNSMLSLQSPVGAEDGLQWDDIMCKADDLMFNLETELLLDALAQKLPHTEMCIIRMKARGERMHDIARKMHMTFHDINQLLEKSRATIVSVLFG